ncbi:hypothetical protein BKA56DRAFT_239428 [Ilyonectria sp. MPI-CAGE-AT-0026]|nr:hypothetical protein BKA56DRAFT_239428 [Ilyonectria sp. MPI-CAGE-AT-0026]
MSSHATTITYSMGIPEPFIALPILVLLSFVCPPFPGRGIAFSALIVFINYLCIISPWPPNEGPTRPLRYGMTCSWIFLLPVLERLLLHQPEEEFWRLDEEKKPKNGRPQEWTPQKLRWALGLLSSPRAVGWNLGSRQLNATRMEIRGSRPTRASFIVAKVLQAALAYLELDAVITLAKNVDIPQRRAWDPVALIKITFLEVLMAISVYSTMTMQFEIVAAFSVGFGLSKPEDWPPLFGSVAQCYTVANVWGKFWHGYLRQVSGVPRRILANLTQPVLGFSHAIINAGGIPKRSLLAYGIHLFIAFLLSTFFHILSLYVVCEGYTMHHHPFDNPTLSSSKKKIPPPKLNTFIYTQFDQNKSYLRAVASIKYRID